MALATHKKDKKDILRAAIFPFLFIALIWFVKGIEVLTSSDFSSYGLYPLDFSGLRGILFSPLIHGSYDHLFNNSIPLLMLGMTLFFFYRKISYKVFFLIYGISGFWLWFFARESFHIGASTIVYGLGSFIFTSGIIRKNKELLAIALIVAFVYGSMVWGIFPLEEGISWEGHLSGMVAGIILAFYYKNYGPAANLNQWKHEMPDDSDILDKENPYWENIDELEDEDRKLVE